MAISQIYKKSYCWVEEVEGEDSEGWRIKGEGLYFNNSNHWTDFDIGNLYIFGSTADLIVENGSLSPGHMARGGFYKTLTPKIDLPDPPFLITDDADIRCQCYSNVEVFDFSPEFEFMPNLAENEETPIIGKNWFGIFRFLGPRESFAYGTLTCFYSKTLKNIDPSSEIFDFMNERIGVLRIVD